MAQEKDDGKARYKGKLYGGGEIYMAEKVAKRLLAQNKKGFMVTDDGKYFNSDYVIWIKPMDEQEIEKRAETLAKRLEGKEVEKDRERTSTVGKK